jgi:hypothetical protein
MQTNWNSMLEQVGRVNEKAVTAAVELNKIATRTQGLLARKQMAALETCLEAGTEQLRVMTEIRDPRALMEAQVQVAARFGEKLAITAQESLNIQAQARDELARWFEDGMHSVQAGVEDMAAPAAAPRTPARRGTRKAA